MREWLQVSLFQNTKDKVFLNSVYKNIIYKIVQSRLYYSLSRWMDIYRILCFIISIFRSHYHVDLVALSTMKIITNSYLYFLIQPYFKFRVTKTILTEHFIVVYLKR